MSEVRRSYSPSKISHTFFAVVVGFTLSASLNAQMLYGWRSIPGVGHVGIYAMDPNSGETVLITDTGIGYFAAEYSTFDPIGHRYFLDGSPIVIEVNVLTRSTTILHVGDVGLLQYDPVTGLLYGMRSVLPSGNLFIFSVDPNTNEIKQVADTGVRARSGGPVLDPVRRRYIFGILEGGQNKLLAVNIDTGATTRFSYDLGGLVFDPVTRLFYGIRFVPATGTFGVFSLDFDTGATTFVADTGITVTSGAFELATFDPVGRRYFQTLDSSTYYVVAVDLRTRNVTRLNNALYDDQFDPGPAPALAVPALDARFLGALAALLALIGFWRTTRSNRQVTRFS